MKKETDNVEKFVREAVEELLAKTHNEINNEEKDLPAKACGFRRWQAGIRELEAKRKIKNKFMEKEINNEEFFDDCPVCRLMKLAKEQGREPTLEELKEAFKKAKEEGGIAGGEY